MKILVTGGAGFIGSPVVDDLVKAEHDVCIVDNLSMGSRSNLNRDASFHEVDICSDALRDVLEQEKPELVYHLAAQIDVTRSVAEPDFDAQVNVLV